MGGIVECGVGIDTKTSPRRAAIEKAQADLRQEYDVREERRRELEFLERGGNPLDFKFAHASSISVQSTSLTDQLAEQYVISEARGSFALAASPHGDSVESSDRPGGSLSREPNIADNLLLLDGENSNLGGERNSKCSGKRGNVAPLEQTSQFDGCHNSKESEDSFIYRLGVKSQAYARRNRSRTSRDSGNNVGSTDLVLCQGNRSLVIPSARPSPRDAKGSIWEAQAEDHAISSICNSKPASPNANVVSKNMASDDHVDMELDAVQTHHTCTDMTKDLAPEGAMEVKSSENLQDNDHNKQHSHVIADRITNGTTSRSSNISGKDEAVSVDFLAASHESTEVVKDASSAEKANGFGAPVKNTTILHDLNTKACVADSVSEALSMSSIKTDPSCVKMISTSVGNANGDQHLMLGKTDGSSAGDSKGHSMFEEASSRLNNKDLKENNQLIAVDVPISGNDESRSVQPNHGNLVIQIKDEVEVCDSRTDVQNETSPFTNVQSMILNSEIPDRKPDKSLGDSNSINKSGIDASTVVSSSCEPAIIASEKRNSTSTYDIQNCAANHLMLSKKAHEDAVLKEAEIIEANLKSAGDLYSCNISSEKRQKCHWDFVLEEMAWMANDFMQERLWKTTAAAQICHWITSSGRAKFEQVNMWRKQKNVARTLAKAIMHFWHSADILRTSGDTPDGMNGECNSDMLGSWKINETKAEKHKVGASIEAEKSGHILRLAVKDYAVKFLKYNSGTSSYPILAEAPTTPDRLCDNGILEISWEDQHSEESLFYTVPPGAMQAYRESVESQWMHYKKMGNTIHHEDGEASMCDSVAEGSRENAYEEDDGETGACYSSGAFEGGLSSNFAHKKRKNVQQKSYALRPYEVGVDLSYEHCLESKSGNKSLSFGKRPSSTLHVGSIPKKRARTAARQRVVSPFSTGVTGSLQVTSKTDVSSGDTNSFQDDQSSLHGGSLPRRNMEIESTVDFERMLPYDGSEMSTKSKKKKKPKHLRYKNSLNLTDSCPLIVSGKGSLYEQQVQVDSIVQHEQMDHLKKRLENQQFESNGNTVIYGQHAAKKPKLLKLLPESSPEALIPVTGSMPSPVASQTSNMPNPSKLIKIIANKDRGRKCKALKMAGGQSGSGNPWSNFEDQALVVLVHDMGPNWELVSDAINSTLQFKCIYRKPKECKERHKFLMDKSAGDGADSAEDSGSSQPYPSTLPGIPKGTARQLFQRLQGPLEEGTLKAHFEKIILLGQQLHSHRNQNENQEQKQVTQEHCSHMVALSQVCPNNLTGLILTPLDLCEAMASSPDVLSLGYQGSHTGGLSITSHQGSMAPIATSNVNTMLQGSPGMVLSSSLPSPSAPLNVTTRDAQRYGGPRPTSLSGDDQRMQQYSQMLSGRNHQQSAMPAHGALPLGVDRAGVRMLPGGNGMGMVCGMNRSMPMPRTSFQGMGPQGMLNMVSTGNMLSSSGHGMQNPVSVHPSVVSGSGNPMLRPRDALQMLRPGQNSEDHRHMLIQELQIQASQGNGQAVTPFNGLSAPISSTTAPPTIQTFPVSQHPQSHQMPQQAHIIGNSQNPHIQGTNQSSPQQQGYAFHFPQEMPLKQRMIPQAQHSFSGSNAVPPIQNSSQIQQQTQSPSPVSPGPSQVQHKQQQIPRNLQQGCGMPNQIMKQRQRQQVQQQPKQQQQQRQQSQQQAKHMKGVGRGSMLMHQNLPVDASQVSSGFSTAPKNQVSEKHLMQQGQGFFPCNLGLSSALPQTGNQQKMYSHVLPQSSKQITPMPSHSDTCNQGSVHGSPSHMLASQQPPVPSSSPLPNHHHQQQHQMNPSQQNIQRMALQQNRQMISDGRVQCSAEQVQATQMIPTTSISHCIDSGTSAPVVSSAAQWKPESSCNVGPPSPTAHLASSPQENLAATETIIPPSSQGVVQRQFSGSVSMHGNIRGQWQQQQPQPQQQQQQQRQVVQGTLYSQPSNLGPG